MTIEKLTEVQQKMADILKQCLSECDVTDYFGSGTVTNKQCSASVEVTFFGNGDVRCATQLGGYESKRSLETHRFEWTSVELDNTEWSVFDTTSR